MVDDGVGAGSIAVGLVPFDAAAEDAVREPLRRITLALLETLVDQVAPGA